MLPSVLNDKRERMMLNPGCESALAYLRVAVPFFHAAEHQRRNVVTTEPVVFAWGDEEHTCVRYELGMTVNMYAQNRMQDGDALAAREIWDEACHEYSEAAAAWDWFMTRHYARWHAPTLSSMTHMRDLAIGMWMTSAPKAKSLSPATHIGLLAGAVNVLHNGGWSTQAADAQIALNRARAHDYYDKKQLGHAILAVRLAGETPTEWERENAFMHVPIPESLPDVAGHVIRPNKPVFIKEIH